MRRHVIYVVKDRTGFVLPHTVRYTEKESKEAFFDWLNYGKEEKITNIDVFWRSFESMGYKVELGELHINSV